MENGFKTKIGKYVIFGIAAIFVVSLLICSIYVVNPGYRAVMITLGKVEPRSIANGIGFKWPFVSTVVDMNVQTNEMTDVGITYTKDVQTAEIKYTFTYNLNPENVWMLYERVGQDYVSKKIVPILNDVIKDVIGKCQAQDLVASRDSARIAITAQLKERIDKVYFQNLTFQIINLDYSDAFEQAIENKVIAAQRAQEAANNTNRITEEAEQKRISAQAEADAMRIKAEALTKNKGLTEYEAVQKWDGKLPQYMLGDAVPFVNLNGR